MYIVEISNYERFVMILDVVTLAASLAAAVLAALALFRKSGITQSQLDTALSSRVDDALREQSRQFSEELRRVRAEVTESVNGAMKLASETQSAAYRQVADVQNVRRRAEQDVEKAHKFALEKFSSDLLPVIDSLVVRSGGRITRKQTYFPLCVASVLGNNLTTISATSMVTAGALLSEAGFRQLGLFEPTAVNLPALLVVIVFYILAGHKLQSRWFDFEEIPPAPEQELSEDALSGVPIWKTWLTLAVTLAVVVLLVCGADTGFAALIGACVLVLTRCVSEREAFASISWQVIIIAAGAIGFSKGMDASGAGAIIASTVIGLFGDGSPFVICIALFVIGSLLSNFMSDNASVAVLIPITLAVAQGMNCDATPLVLSAASGIKVALATPISVTPMTMIGVPGYRFKDYLRMGGLVNLISLAVTSAAIYVIYFM